MGDQPTRRKAGEQNEGSRAQMSDAEFAHATDGTRIHGDDFTPDQIAAWYADEAEGYAELFEAESDKRYPYFAVNELHGWSRLPPGRVFKHVLGLGAAHGDELAPISKRAERVTVLEPTDAFTRAELHGVPASYVKPGVDGGMPFEDARFDLVTCFGVLHHICTVTRVLNEIGRVTARNGWLLVREPVVSMGDWRRPRGGLTRRERGIPPHLLRERVERAGFEIVRFAWCFAPVVSKPLRKLVGPPYNSPLACRIDALASSLLSVNFHYHATSAIQKFRPTCAFVVGRRR